MVSSFFIIISTEHCCGEFGKLVPELTGVRVLLELKIHKENKVHGIYRLF